jgi:signal peptidase II
MADFPRSRYCWFGAISAGALAWDLASKSWVFSSLGYENRTSDWSWATPLLWGRFEIRLTTHFNQGALFGIGQGLGWLFAVLSVVAAAAIVYWLFVRGEARSLWLTVALALVLAGALGNLYDRLHLHGCRKADGTPQRGVRDFIDCTIPWIGTAGWFRLQLVREKEWPIFNFADTYLVAGALALVSYSLFSRPLRPAAPGRGSSSTHPARTAECPARTEGTGEPSS